MRCYTLYIDINLDIAGNNRQLPEYANIMVLTLDMAIFPFPRLDPQQIGSLAIGHTIGVGVTEILRQKLIQNVGIGLPHGFVTLKFQLSNQVSGYMIGHFGFQPL
jgi:hypothetical protein